MEVLLGHSLPHTVYCYAPLATSFILPIFLSLLHLPVRISSLRYSHPVQARQSPYAAVSTAEGMHIPADHPARYNAA